MAITNEATGRVSVCGRCEAEIEEARLMKGLRLPVWDDESKPPAERRQVATRVSAGLLVWRTVDAGFGSAVCRAADARHEPTSIRYRSARRGVPGTGR